LQTTQRLREARQALALLLDDGRRCALDEARVAELGLRLRDLGLQPCDLLGQACAFGPDVDLDVQRDAQVADDRHRRGRGGLRERGVVGDQAHLGEPGQRCEHGAGLGDEAGIGRTGQWFGYQWAEIRPDVITLAKGLGSGVPIGAVVARGRAAGVLGPGNHGSTFGGGPLACRAGLETLLIIEEEKLMANAAAQGERIRAGFARELAGVPGVVAIRGQGLMIGIELDRPCGDLVKRALDARVLINVTQERVIRLLPPLIIGAHEADEIVARLAPVVLAFLTETAAQSV